MSFALLDWLILFGVALIAWLLGSYQRKSSTWRGYFLATQQLSSTRVAATYFGANLTFTAIFLILSEEAYRRGPWVFSVPACWFLGTILFVACYPKLQPYIEQEKTLHEAIGDSFQSTPLRKWASLWTILAFVGTVGLELFGGIKLLIWADLPFVESGWWVALGLAFLLCAFTVRGGFRGVAIADIWLDLVALAMTILIAVKVLPFVFGAGHLHVKLPEETSLPSLPGIGDNLLFVLGMVFIFVPFQFCTLDSWQRLIAWKKKKKKQSPTGLLIASSAVLCLAYCVPILVGMAVRKQGLTIPNGSHPLKEFLAALHFWPGVIGFVFGGFLAAVFSTCDELLNCCGLSFLFDTLQISKSDSGRSPDAQSKLVTSGMFYTSVFGVVSVLIAFLAVAFERKISEMALAIFSGQVVFVLPLTVVLFWPQYGPKLARGAKWSMLVGFASAVAFVILAWIVNDRQIADAAPLGAFVLSGIVFGAFAFNAWRTRKTEQPA